jgi:hypothetical protein
MLIFGEKGLNPGVTGVRHRAHGLSRNADVALFGAGATGNNSQMGGGVA